jgi:hypothetical protein
MAKATTKQLPAKEKDALLTLLYNRFEKAKDRHKGLDWKKVRDKLEAAPGKLWSLQQMEASGGEPAFVHYDAASGNFIFMDCAPESPKERRSLCYDRSALDARKENKPAGNAMEAAAAMGIDLLNEEEYRLLQEYGSFDTKTSSWLQTPEAVRKLGGAIFGDRRYNRVFIYHNGAESYYAARGFRGVLKV